jgi:hypothetical protein
MKRDSDTAEASAGMFVVSGAGPEHVEALAGAVAMCLRAVVKKRARS